MIDLGKQAAGVAAAELVEDGMSVGLGTGSTVAYFLTALAQRRLDIRALATSPETFDRATSLGLEVVPPGQLQHLDLCVDGADELTRDLVVTKGGGGALLREKVVAEMSDAMIVIATPDKVVDRLAETFPLPVEVVDFALPSVKHQLVNRGYQVRQRAGRTVNGNIILDCHLPGGIEDPELEAVVLALIAGIAEHGLFVDLATTALLGSDDGRVETLGQVSPTS